MHPYAEGPSFSPVLTFAMAFLLLKKYRLVVKATLT